MSLAKVTLMGYYNAYIDDTEPLFHELTLPAGIDKETFINALLLDCGEMEVLYANPEFYRNAIGIWGKKWYRTFEKWYEALSIQYDPLNNYDRTEEWTTRTDSTSNAESLSKRSSYDSAALEPYSGMEDSGTYGGTENRTGHAYGNIGVTTSQQMLQSELDLQEWNLYQHMIDLFKMELLIPVY